MTNELKPPARRGRPPGSTAAKTAEKKLAAGVKKPIKKPVKAPEKPKKTPEPKPIKPTPQNVAYLKPVEVAKPFSSGHGGARRNSGPKRKDYQPSEVEVNFDEARARNETAKAGLNEIELKIKAGEYIARAAVQSASATALATMAQTMRSIPDNMERKGIPPETCAMVERIIDEVMAGLSQELEILSEGEFDE